MNERIQRNGRARKVHKGGGVDEHVVLYDVLSEDMRTVLTTCEGIDAAVKALEREVRIAKLACPTGGCDD